MCPTTIQRSSSPPDPVIPVWPELVEGHGSGSTDGFDRLSPNGGGEPGRLARGAD